MKNECEVRNKYAGVSAGEEKDFLSYRTVSIGVCEECNSIFEERRGEKPVMEKGHAELLFLVKEICKLNYGPDWALLLLAKKAFDC